MTQVGYTNGYTDEITSAYAELMSAEAMMRVRASTRDQIMRIATEDYGGATADETLRRLIDEHWERKAIEAVERFRQEDPEGYADYLGELKDWDATASPELDAWNSGVKR